MNMQVRKAKLLAFAATREKTGKRLFGLAIMHQTARSNSGGLTCRQEVEELADRVF